MSHKIYPTILVLQKKYYPRIKQLSVKKKKGASSVRINFFKNGITPMTMARTCAIHTRPHQFPQMKTKQNKTKGAEKTFAL